MRYRYLSCSQRTGSFGHVLCGIDAPSVCALKDMRGQLSHGSECPGVDSRHI